MSRTLRSEPGSSCWMRRPHHLRAEKEIAAADEAIAEFDHPPNRRAIPPSAWDDLLVSHWRGQEWARKYK